jgi:Arc/MetJ-type ribon-helix-helix transcriptional regulator
MRVTVNIPDELMNQVRAASGERSNAGAVVKAMESYVHLKGRDALRRLQGKIAIEYDWQEAEQCELKAEAESGR